MRAFRLTTRSYAPFATQVSPHVLNDPAPRVRRPRWSLRGHALKGAVSRHRQCTNLPIPPARNARRGRTATGRDTRNAVGFVGAVESKEALIDNPRGIPSLRTGSHRRQRNDGRRSQCAGTAGPMNATGKLIGVGVGPGDPEAPDAQSPERAQSADVVAHFAKAGNPSNARASVRQYLEPGVTELPLLYPVTTEEVCSSAAYRSAVQEFFDKSAADVAAHLNAGKNVAVLSEGDPLLLGRTCTCT